MSEGSSRLNFPKNSKPESVAKNSSAAKESPQKGHAASHGTPSMTSILPSAAFFGTLLRYGFQFSIFLFIIFIILVIIHQTINPIFDFSASFTSERAPSSDQGREMSAFTVAPAAVDQSANFASPPSCNLTLSVDLQQQGDQKSTTIPRVFLQRAKSAIALPHSLPSSTSNDVQLLEQYPDANLILHMDPIKNDLQVTAITQETVDPKTVKVETSKPIENIPVRTPVRITVVFTEKMMEIQLNGKLQVTHPFTQPPITTTADFYAQPSQVGTSLQIGNLRVQDQPLPPSAIRTNGVPAASSFFT